MTPDSPARPTLPEPVRRTLDDFRTRLGLDVHLWKLAADGERVRLYPTHGSDAPPADSNGPPRRIVRTVSPRDGPDLELELLSPDGEFAESLTSVLKSILERIFDFAQEVRFFTYELSERYEEINLLYSISETLGSILKLEDAAQNILVEVCDVLGARRGSLWVYEPEGEQLHLRASVGAEEPEGPLRSDDPVAVTAQVFRDGRSLIASKTTPAGANDPEQEQSILSVPIRYTPPSGEARTVGVINLVGRRNGERFTASDQKLLSAIASQVGAALENNRLIQESLAQERMSSEMELAHNLQMKLLQAPETFDAASVAARVVSAEQVGGDFYHLFKLPDQEVGVMIGDVSTHGFPAALIMALSMSAASIYAMESGGPSSVLRHMADALSDELETTEMYLSLFYAVIDADVGQLRYSNAGHPHAFIIHGDGEAVRLLATDPPIGIAGPEAYGEEVIPWDAGSDLLFLFTDGLSDTLTVPGGQNGEQCVIQYVVEHREDPVDAIVSGLVSLAEAATPSLPSDDRTVIVFRS
ncbi:MAG: SpoIIE family protein phosphatase [Gemmatimonadetes bacterium]|nr:SpoIIE family protein phosphatase [Gemmatimonadota bacterium]